MKRYASHVFARDVSDSALFPFAVLRQIICLPPALPSQTLLPPLQVDKYLGAVGCALLHRHILKLQEKKSLTSTY